MSSPRSDKDSSKVSVPSHRAERSTTTTTARHRVSAVPIRENAFRDAVKAYAERRGWKVMFHWSSLHSPAGWPDLFMLRDQRMVVAELKVGRGKLTDAQVKWLDAFRWLDKGAEVYVWKPDQWDDGTIEKVLT